MALRMSDDGTEVIVRHFAFNTLADTEPLACRDATRVLLYALPPEKGYREHSVRLVPVGTVITPESARDGRWEDV
jgi:hypothetical protein